MFHRLLLLSAIYYLLISSSKLICSGGLLTLSLLRDTLCLLLWVMELFSMIYLLCLYQMDSLCEGQLSSTTRFGIWFRLSVFLLQLRPTLLQHILSCCLHLLSTQRLVFGLTRVSKEQRKINLWILEKNQGLLTNWSYESNWNYFQHCNLLVVYQMAHVLCPC